MEIGIVNFIIFFSFITQFTCPLPLILPQELAVLTILERLINPINAKPLYTQLEDLISISMKCMKI